VFVTEQLIALLVLDTSSGTGGFHESQLAQVHRDRPIVSSFAGNRA
jgi:hypothetical protein